MKSGAEDPAKIGDDPSAWVRLLKTIVETAESFRMKSVEIERLRGVAVMMTILTHSSLIHPRLGIPGWAGVDLFFVISGFVVTTSLLKRFAELPESGDALERLELARTAIKSYFIRRFFRIVPLAAFIPFAHLLLASTFNRSGVFGAPVDVAREIVAIATGAYNYTLAAGLHSELLSVYWSLAVEEQFYLVLPIALILAGTAKRRLTLVVAGIAAVAFVIRPLCNQGLPADASWSLWRSETHLRADALMGGVMLAILRSRGWSASLSVPTFASKASVYLALAALLVIPRAFMKADVLPSVLLVVLWLASGWAVLLASSDSGHVLNVPVLRRALGYLGSRSYALYLGHMVALRIALEIAHRTTDTTALRCVLFVFLNFLIAEALHRSIERPLHRLGLKKADAVDAAAASRSVRDSSESNPLGNAA